MSRTICLLALVTLFGCGGPSIAPPKFNASKVTNTALELFDTNGDGTLDKTELKASPSLTAGLPTIDTDGDKQISSDELETRIKQFVESKTGSISVSCRFMKGKKPVTKAEVIFEPAPFLTGVIQEATGKTDRTGEASMKCAAVPFGIQQGFYRVRINDSSLPPKFNTETTLGAEVSGRARGNQIGIYEFQLE